MVMFKHREAYALMNYRCECGAHRLIWNSRDGVTPFMVACFVCRKNYMSHVDWGEDCVVLEPHLKPGDLVFVTETRDDYERRCEAQAKEIWEANLHNVRDEYSSPDQVYKVLCGYYKEGQPTVRQVQFVEVSDG